jgi:hypothetical protein
MALGSIRSAYEVYTQHDFSRGFQWRLIDMSGVPEYVVRELLDKPFGKGGLYYINTATVPGRTLGDADVTYQGFPFRIPGPVQYQGTWPLTFKTPSDYLGRNALERWHFEIFSDETSCGRFKVPCPNATIDFGLMNHECRIIRQYRLVGIYPHSIGEISYDVAEGVQVTTFNVEFKYQWWRPVPANNQQIFSGTEDNVDGVYQDYYQKIMSQTGNC